ncbi:MAG: methyltransferase domain-containing protein [Bacteroidetes bacterium]|nr:methyltransferase domain-containing protein [Bacteroidota bacterium]
MNCRFCKTPLTHQFIDLFNSPPSNSFLTEVELNEPETFYPLKVYTCHHCFLVQVDEYKKSSAIFNSEYVYFSSYSTSWLEHAKKYTEMMVERFQFNQQSKVIEIASNDGYLLQYFHQKKIPVLGVEPTLNTADAARAKGIESINDFFGVALAKKMIAQNTYADLLIGNNVLAHVPDIVDFVAGMKLVLAPQGVITMEFPHLMELVDNNQFDTIYHEHFSYLSLYSVKQIFESQGLEVFDVEQLPTHGGSLRLFAKHKADTSKTVLNNVQNLLNKELEKGIATLAYYQNFQEKALKVKLDTLNLLISLKQQNKKVAAYGAAAKGNTLLNYCGVKNDLISFVVDANPSKQNKFLPGSHIPVKNQDFLKKEKPDYIFILPWNLKEEIKQQLSYIQEWGGKFIIPIPEIAIM